MENRVPGIRNNNVNYQAKFYLNRVWTMIHFIARAPFTPGSLKSNWSWHDEDLPEPLPIEVQEEIQAKAKRHLERSLSHIPREVPESGVDNLSFDSAC